MTRAVPMSLGGSRASAATLQCPLDTKDYIPRRWILKTTSQGLGSTHNDRKCMSAASSSSWNKTMADCSMPVLLTTIPAPIPHSCFVLPPHVHIGNGAHVAQITDITTHIRCCPVSRQGPGPLGTCLHWCALCWTQLPSHSLDT